MLSKVRISYPRTEYVLLNQNLVEQLNMVIREFVEYEKVIAKQDLHYTLDIIDEQYQYEDYISYVFHISIYTGGAHPNSVILTVNYDRRGNQMITVNDIIKNSDILNKVCIESRRQLQLNEVIGKDQNSVKMLMEGTSPHLNNFKNFIFDKEGIIVYFQQNQVAPYSSEIFQVVLPYQLFNV